jgi:hypothetical protein
MAILVDLDGTLAEYHGWTSYTPVGNPVPKMVERVKEWIAQGKDVRIFTARACDPSEVPEVEDWCAKHLGVVLPVTNVKEWDAEEIWDDRAVGVRLNSGERADGLE